LKNQKIGAMCAYIFMVAGAFLLLLYYFPIYIQATQNDSALYSGIKNLPLVPGPNIFTITSGCIITVIGHHIPLMLLGYVISGIACGLLYTFEIRSSTGEWLNCQVIADIGVGLILSIPVIVSQSIFKPSDLSSVFAMIFSSMG